MKHIAGIFAAALLVAGCVQQMEQLEEYQSPVFTASFENAATKTYLDSGRKLLWTADDRLSIFVNTYNQQYRYTGESGKTSADFEEVKVSGFHSGNTLSTNYAVYPYKPDTEITNDGTITCTLPAVQAYAENSFGLGANTMVAVTSSPDDYFLPFRNLCGYLVVKFYGEGTVKSISIKGNDGEKIAGKATVVAKYAEDPQTTMSETATDCITVDCGETGVVLSATSAEATEFWFCIPPVTFSKGFTVTATDVNGKVFEKGVSSSKTISRNVINPLSALEVSLSSRPAVPEMVDLDLPSGIKWASFNLGASKPEEYGGYYQWAGLEDVTDINIYLDYNNCPYHTGSNYPTGWTKYIPSNKSSYWSGPGSPDNKTVLDPEDDVAHVTLGGKWRMPTKAEFQELIDNCTSEWTTMNGVKGSKFISNKNGNSIFLPAAGCRSNDYLDNARSDGYYWSSSLDTVYPYRAYSMNFYSDYVYTYNYYRYSGLSVRPVYDENSIPSEDKQYDIFTGVIENSGGSTKVSISESDYYIRWSQSDSIIVTNMGKEGNCAYSLQSGAGTQSATFLASGSPRFTRDDTLVGLFDLPAIDDMTYMWSSNQEYREGDDVYSPMTATRDGDNKLTFRPAGGYIFIQITGTGTVSSIDFSADEAMSGLVSIDGNAELSSYGQGGNSIHLNCGEGIELDESNYSTYLKISLLPNEYHNLSITVTGTGGKQITKKSPKALYVEKGRISFIRIRDVDLTAPEMVDLGLPSGLKWAS